MNKRKSNTLRNTKSLEVISVEQFGFFEDILKAYQKEISKRKKVFRKKQSVT